MNTSDWIALLAALTALIAFAYQLYAVRTQLAIHNFTTYTARYENIVQRLHEEIYDADFQLDANPKYAEIMIVMRNYFDLCFEEWYLKDNGYLDSSIWELWKSGIATAMARKAFIAAWAIIKLDTVYSAKFVEFIDSLQSPRSFPSKRIRSGAK